MRVTTYTPGSHAALVGPVACAVVAVPPDSAVVRALWPVIAAGAPFAELIGVLMADGLARLPEFVLVSWGDDGTTVLRRGGLDVVVSGDVLAAPRVSTWSEESFPVGAGVRIGTGGVTFPLMGGVVGAAGVEYDPAAVDATVWAEAVPVAVVPEAVPTPPALPVPSAVPAPPLAPELSSLLAPPPGPVPVVAPAPPFDPDRTRAQPRASGGLIDGYYPGGQSPPAQTPTAPPAPPQPGHPHQPALPEPGHADHTRLRSDLASSSGAALVLAVRCPSGHHNPADAPACRVCGVPVANRAATRIPQPVLGVLTFGPGRDLALHQDWLIGRDPLSGGTTEGRMPQPFAVASPDLMVSRQHLRVEVRGWEVLVVDLRSANGSAVVPAGGVPVPLRPEEPTPIAPGTRVILADQVECVYEVRA